MTNHIPLIDDPDRLQNEAFEKGRIAADRGLPRECEFTAPLLRTRWFTGYDDQAPRSWTLPRRRFWTGLPSTASSPKTVDPKILDLRNRLRSIVR